MQSYHIETKLIQDHTLTLTNMPFSAGEVVEVIVLRKEDIPLDKRYALCGLPIPVPQTAQATPEAE
jgi:hypothetical protein